MHLRTGAWGLTLDLMLGQQGTVATRASGVPLFPKQKFQQRKGKEVVPAKSKGKEKAPSKRYIRERQQSP